MICVEILGDGFLRKKNSNKFLARFQTIVNDYPIFNDISTFDLINKIPYIEFFIMSFIFYTLISSKSSLEISQILNNILFQPTVFIF